jgi:acyl carrier protein
MTQRMNEHGDSLRGRLIRLVSQLLGSASALPDPFPDQQQLSDLGLSSLKMVNLMLAIELEFDIAIPPADINPETFHSLSSMSALVARLTAPHFKSSG